MDINSEQFQLKKTLVDLEDAHTHLQVSISHLEQEIRKREIDIQKLLAERELELIKENPDYRKRFKTNQKDPVEAVRQSTDNLEYSSEFAKQVGQLLNNINRTSEEISTLIKL